jgi:hypothetical protein
VRRFGADRRSHTSICSADKDSKTLGCPCHTIHLISIKTSSTILRCSGDFACPLSKKDASALGGNVPSAIITPRIVGFQSSRRCAKKRVSFRSPGMALQGLMHSCWESNPNTVGIDQCLDRREAILGPPSVFRIDYYPHSPRIGEQEKIPLTIGGTYPPFPLNHAV